MQDLVRSLWEGTLPTNISQETRTPKGEYLSYAKSPHSHPFSAMAYGVRVLGVQHVVVLGHYGCGGIAAAIATAPKSKIDVATHIIQTWIGDVRNLYLSSNRTEIAIMRERNLAIEAAGGVVGEPEVRDPGFRALVEENVKVQVARISKSSVITNVCYIFT